MKCYSSLRLQGAWISPLTRPKQSWSSHTQIPSSRLLVRETTCVLVPSGLARDEVKMQAYALLPNFNHVARARSRCSIPPEDPPAARQVLSASLTPPWFLPRKGKKFDRPRGVASFWAASTSFPSKPFDIYIEPPPIPTSPAPQRLKWWETKQTRLSKKYLSYLPDPMRLSFRALGAGLAGSCCVRTPSP